MAQFVEEYARRQDEKHEKDGDVLVPGEEVGNPLQVDTDPRTQASQENEQQG